MARNFTPVGPERHATQAPSFFPNHTQINPDVALLTNGRFALVHEYHRSTTDIDIRLQFLNADGTLFGNSIPIDANEGYQISPVVAPRLSGGAVVVWHDQNGRDGGGNVITNDIQLMVVGSDGTPLSGQVTVAGGDDPHRAPDAATLGDGRVVVVWETDYGTDSDISLRVLKANGTGFNGDPIAIDLHTTIDSVTPAIAASGNNALVAYRDDNNDIIRVKLFNGATETFNSTGTSLGAAVSGAGVASSPPDVAVLPGGRYVVVWKNHTTGGIEARFVNANGAPTGAVFPIANPVGSDGGPRVAALPDGGFIVTWENGGGAIAPEKDGSLAVLARRFEATGEPAGDVFLVNTGYPNTQYNSTVAVNPGTGRAFIAWEDWHSYAGQGDPPGIRGRLFTPTTDIVNGTPGNDTITTYNLSETIYGHAGNDTINARGGRDTVYGGAGNDNLRGGLGDDTMSGGPGNDTVNGEGGNDKLDGGPGVDIVLGGPGNDTMAGGDGADTMNGEAGNDTLNGGLGNDALTGGPGADRFVFNTKINPKGSNVDTIADFSAADDTILLDNAIFKKLKQEGPLKAKFFEVGKKAKSKKDFIVYNDKNGNLSYDKNGSKKGGAIVFAKLEGSPDDVSAADFLVI